MAAKTMEEIADMLKGMKFRRKLFRGVPEEDVWRVIDKLQREYRSVLEAERIKTEALIEEREEIILRLRTQLKAERARALMEDSDA